MESDEPIIRARDLMERNVIVVTPRTPIYEVHRLFVENEIHGAPVVGDDETILGVVSSLDLLRITEDFQEQIADLTAAHAMTREIVAVGPDATADDVARAMLDRQIHRVLVVENGVLVGIISTFDLLRTLGHPTATAAPTGLTRHTGYSR